MNSVRKFPTIYALSSTGKVKEWTAEVFSNTDGTAVIQRSYGQVGKKITVNKKTVKKGKNIGKSNETTPVEQALLEAMSDINKKRDANHEYEMIDPNNYVPRVILPQLAKGPKKGKIVFPCDMQPKLNGICCLSRKFNGTPDHKMYSDEYMTWKGIARGNPEVFVDMMAYHSRGGKLFETLEHLNPFLLELLATNEMVHGELYVHGWSLQKIGSYTKELKPDSHLLEYWIYDHAVVGPKWEDRWFDIVDRVAMQKVNWTQKGDGSIPIKLVPTIRVNSYEEAKYWHDKWVADGFEGGMLRNLNGIYLFEFNSKDLEKVKEFEDAEFKIVGGKEGTGNDEGCIIFKCETTDGKEFDVRPRGTVEQRREDFQKLDSYIGESLTVRYAELSDDGIPLQPVGIVIRDYE